MFAQKHCKNIKINSFKVFFLIAGFILVFFTFFCSSKKSSDMCNQKELQISEKLHILEFFKRTHLKLL